MAKSQPIKEDSFEMKINASVAGDVEHLSSFRSTSAYNDSFVNIDNGVNAKNGMTWRDYNYFRPDEALPKSIKGLAKSCDIAYFRVPIVRTAIDLMSDFGCQGIHVVHPNKNNQKFYNDWFNYVDGPKISERFLNYLYRRGNLAVSRMFGRLRETDLDKLEVAKANKKARAGDFANISQRKPAKNELPLSYAFLDICTLDVDSPEISAFMGEKAPLALNIPMKLRRIIKNPKTKQEVELVKILEQNDPDLVAQMRAGKNKILLNPYLVTPYYYKKDDWMDWAMPPLACILDSLVGWEKMQLADRSALDGAISNIRLWKLGDLERQIAPSPEQMERLSSLITNHPGGGTLDLIWHPAIELVESKTTVHQFLGAAKYEPIWQAIFQGLGIPPTLTGSPTASGTTNNFIALKTLIERLEYGRSVLKRFWEHELKLVQQARGFRFPAEIHFERMSLSDEVAEKSLLRDLYDRGLMSAEALLERFGEIPDLERIRKVQEEKQVKAGRRIKSGGPWNNPEPEAELRKIALQGQAVTTDELGMELEPRKKGKVPLAEQQFELQKQQMDQDAEIAKKQQEVDHELQRDQHEFDKGLKEKKQNDDQKIKRQQVKKTKPKGVSGQGRPKNKKDSSKRKPRTVKPRTSATQIQLWAADAQERISELVVPEYLKSIGKKNLRQVSAEQFDELEARKFGTLASLEPLQEVSDDELLEIFSGTTSDLIAANPAVYSTYTKSAASLKNPTANNLRQLQVISYTRAKRREYVQNQS